MLFLRVRRDGVWSGGRVVTGWSGRLAAARVVGWHRVAQMAAWERRLVTVAACREMWACPVGGR